MKKRCAGMAVVTLLLVAFGIGKAETDFHGVLDPRNVGSGTVIDSVRVTPPGTVYATPSWHGQGMILDTFDFPNLDAWPTKLEIYAVTNAIVYTTTINNPKGDSWYFLQYPNPNAPKVKFYGAGGGPAVEEPRTAVEPLQRLTVSPSVVTGQMTVRLQPVGPGRAVVDIHDAVGNVVRTLECTAGADGRATATWNREDGFGCLVPEGVYFCRYAASGVAVVRKVLVTH